jgi:hypothetical protein
MTPAQRNMLSIGARADIERIVGTRANDVEALKQLIKSDGDWNRSRLGQIFGRDKADAIFRVIERETTFRDSHNKIVENSQTEMRRAGRDMVRRTGPDQTSVRDTTLTGLLAEGARRSYRGIRGVLTAGKQESVDNELAHALTRQGGARDDLLRQIRNAQSRRKPGGNLTREVLVRAMLNANAARLGNQ